MKPYKGAIVLTFVDPRENNGSDVAPAIVTHAGPTWVNLRILHDGPSVPSEGSTRQDWRTSVPLHATREEALAAHEAADLMYRTPVPFRAFWPPQPEREPGDRPPRY